MKTFIFITSIAKKNMATLKYGIFLTILTALTLNVRALTNSEGVAAERTAWNGIGTVLRDGVYMGTANGFRSTITLQVTISGGRITAIRTASAADTPAYYKRVERALPPVIIQRQTPDVDAVSGATISSNGYKNAVRDALNKAAVE